MRSQRRNDDGLGLIESLVAAALLLVALAVFGSLYVVTDRASKSVQDVGIGTDALTVALANLDAQVRSAYWVELGSPVACTAPDGTSTSCPVLKILAPSPRAPYAATCIAWTLSPLPGLLGGNVDPFNRYGRLQFMRYTPGVGSLPEWRTAVSGIDVTESSFDVSGFPYRAFNPASGAVTAVRHSGVSAVLSVAQDDAHRIKVPLIVASRNAQVSASTVGGDPVANYTCGWPA